jgi:hypothetical protein
VTNWLAPRPTYFNTEEICHSGLQASQINPQRDHGEYKASRDYGYQQVIYNHGDAASDPGLASTRNDRRELT